MIAAARPATASITMRCLGRRKHHARTSSVGQIARPIAMLKDATNPAHNRINAVDSKRLESSHIFGSSKNARVAPTITEEFSQLKPPDVVIAARPIQKLPTITIRVDTIFAVRLAV